MWNNMPAWKDEKRDVYRKQLITHINRIRRRILITETDQRKLSILERELMELERKEQGEQLC